MGGIATIVAPRHCRSLRAARLAATLSMISVRLGFASARMSFYPAIEAGRYAFNHRAAGGDGEMGRGGHACRATLAHLVGGRSNAAGGQSRWSGIGCCSRDHWSAVTGCDGILGRRRWSETRRRDACRGCCDGRGGAPGDRVQLRDRIAWVERRGSSRSRRCIGRSGKLKADGVDDACGARRRCVLSLAISRMGSLGQKRGRILGAIATLRSL